MSSTEQAESVADPVVAVAGFGYFPKSFVQLLDNFTRKFENDFQSDMNDSSYRNSVKCETMSFLSAEGLVPRDFNISLPTCDVFFDNVSCFPATPAGTTRFIPCMESYRGVLYDTSGKSSFIDFVV